MEPIDIVIPAAVLVIVSLILSIVVTFPEEKTLAEGVVEITNVICNDPPEDKAPVSCLVDVKIPETTSLNKAWYFRMLEPGEEVAQEEEDKS